MFKEEKDFGFFVCFLTKWLLAELSHGQRQIDEKNHSVLLIPNWL